VGAVRWSTLVVWAVVACGGKDSASSKPEPGAISVQVRDLRGVPVEGALVTTEPDTGDAETDAAGRALIADIAPNFYHVLAQHDVGGVDAAAVWVGPGDLAEVALLLEGGGAFGSGGSSAGGSGGTFGATGGTGGSFGGTIGSSGGSSGTFGGSSGSGGSAGAGATQNLPYIDAATQIETMRVDTKRPYLYALDRVNNNFLFVNLDAETVEKTIYVGSDPVDFDFDEAGDLAYVANFGSTEIAVVDLEMQAIDHTYFVDPSQSIWSGNPYRLAVTAGNTLAYTSEDQWQDIKLVNRENGGFIALAGDLYAPDLATSPDRATLYAAESGGALHRYTVTDSGLTEVDVSTDGGSPSVLVSGDGEYVFFGNQKILASNLKSVVGQFSETIRAVNFDGSVAVGSSSVYDGVDFSIRGLLPLTTSTLALSHDDTTLYAYDIGTSRIYIIDLSAI
jgi:DNA-binding beta-propeller fold protein YncE